MAFVFADRVQETSATTGTGTITLAGAVSGFQSFSAVGDGNSTYYGIVNANGEWENGIGTYTASGTTLSRTTVLSSSNSGNLVNFSAGTKNVFVNYPAGRAAAYDTATPSTGSFNISVGTTGERPSSPAVGMIRYNTTESKYEVYDGTYWSFLTPTVYPYNVEYLVVAGGGASGKGGGGGGGGGGFRTASGATVVPGTAYTITVGAGGATQASPSNGLNGNDSSIVGGTSPYPFASPGIVSTGGGGGGGNNPATTNGQNGGSGGGGAVSAGSSTGGTGNTPSTSPSQGNNGGNNTSSANYGSGGGGGASAAGTAGTTSASGGGGAGTASTISGSSVTYAGGGGGGASMQGATLGTGGAGGGANGAAANTNGNAGTANTGGGAGGSGGGGTNIGGTGGSGIVIISYSGAQRATGGTVTSSGGNTIHTFTSSGTFTA